MKNLIICFSGSGNSYYIANNIAQTMEDSKVEMVNNINLDNFETPERLGFVFPIHCGVEPIVIDNFITQILAKQNNLNKLAFVYILSNAAFPLSFWGLKRTETLLKNIGISTSYANSFKMPHNIFNKSNKAQNSILIGKTNIKIDKVASDLKDEKYKFPKWKPKFIGYIHYLIYLSFSRHFSEEFKVSDDCIGCNLCYRGCPSGNITMVNSKPTFGENCLACTACINNCPTQAISTKKGKNSQYKNPEINFKQEYRK